MIRFVAASRASKEGCWIKLGRIVLVKRCRKKRDKKIDGKRDKKGQEKGQ